MTWETFSKWLDEKKLGVVMIVLCLTPMFVPIAIPMSISPQTKDFYNEILKRPKGDVVVIAYDLALPAPRASSTYNVAILDFLCKQGLRIIMISFGTQSAQAWNAYMTYVQPDKKYGYVYGRDWVILPYLAGEETAMAAIAANLRIFTKDNFGNTIADLPIMQGINTMNDITLAIVTAGTFTIMDAIVRQWPTSNPNVRLITYYTHATVAPYYGKQVFGDLDWYRGYAEFEYLTGFQGEELVTLTARNLLVGAVLVIVIVGNIFYHRDRLSKSRVPAKAEGVSNQ